MIQKFFLWIAASLDDAVVVNPNGIKKWFNTIFLKGNPVFSNGPKSLPKNPDCPILCNWVYDNFILADGPFVKGLRRFETCVLVNNN